MRSAAPIRIVVADDHEIFRDGFAGLLKKQKDIILVGQAEDGKQLISVAEVTQPDVILTDIKMPVMDGIEATKYIYDHLPHIKVIALSMFNDDHYVLDMIDAGARGYLLKNADKTQIIEAIKAVYRDEFYYCNETSAKLTHLLAYRNIDEKRIAPVPYFNPQEREVIRLICSELSTKEIAVRMNLSVRTIEGYRKRIHEKMKVRNVVGIVVYSIKNKLIEID